MQFVNNTRRSGRGRVDVPLSVWPVWDDEHLIELLVKQFTVKYEKVVLVGLAGANRVVEARRTAVAFCDAEAAEAEYAKLHATGPKTALFGFIEPICERTAPDLFQAAEHTAALTVCTDDPERDSTAWAALAATVRPFGLLAAIWDEDRPTLKSRIACEAAELRYVGHLVTARVSSFDRAAVTAESLAQAEPGIHGRVLEHLGLWAKYPRSGL